MDEGMNVSIIDVFPKGNKVSELFDGVNVEFEEVVFTSPLVSVELITCSGSFLSFDMDVILPLWKILRANWKSHKFMHFSKMIVAFPNHFVLYIRPLHLLNIALHLFTKIRNYIYFFLYQF